QPRRRADVHLVAEAAVRVAGEVPGARPRRAAVRTAEEDDVRPPGDLGRDHDRVRVLAVDGQPAVAEVVVRGAQRDRADLRPRAGRGVVLPDVALGPVIRAAGVAGREVEEAAGGVQDALVRDVPGRLAGDALPAGPAVRGPVHGVLLV